MSKKSSPSGACSHISADICTSQKMRVERERKMKRVLSPMRKRKDADGEVSDVTDAGDL